MWVSSNASSTDWAWDSSGHTFRAHEDRTAGGRVVHTHEAGNGTAVNMRYEANGGWQSWMIDQGPAPPTAPPSFPLLSSMPRPLPIPSQVHVPAIVPVTTHTHTHVTHCHSCFPAPAPVPGGVCGILQPNLAKIAAEAAAAAAKRDAAAKELAEAKAHYEAILALVHAGEEDEWTKYTKDLARYYRDLGYMTEAKAISEKRLGAFDINNFWGFPKT